MTARTTLSILAGLALAAPALAQGTPPSHDRRVTREDIRLVPSADGAGWMIEVTPRATNWQSDPIDIGTICDVSLNGSPMGPALRPKIMAGHIGYICAFGGCGGECTQGSCVKYGNGASDCACYEHMERVIHGPLDLRDGDVIEVSLSAAPGAVPEVFGGNETASFPVHVTGGLVNQLTGTAAPVLRGARRYHASLAADGDGVEVLGWSTGGMQVAVDMTSVLTPPPGSPPSEARVRYRGWDGTIKGTTRVSSGAPGSPPMFHADFADSGAAQTRYWSLDESGALTDTGVMPDAGLAALPPCTGPTPYIVYYFQWIAPGVVQIKWYCSSTQWGWGPGGPGPTDTARTIILQPEYPVGSAGLGDVASMAVTGAGFTDLFISDHALLNYSTVAPDIGVGPHARPVTSYALGNAQLADVCPVPSGGCMPAERRLSNRGLLGSSGQDGVAIDFPGDATSTSIRKEFKGHVTLMKFTDDEGQEAMRITESPPSSGEPGIQLAPDATAVGSANTIAECFGPDGEPLGYVTIPYPGFIMVDGNCPPGSTPVYQQHGSLLFFIGCNTSFDLVVPGGPTIPGVHSIAFSPENAALSRTATRCEMTCVDGVEVAGVDFSSDPISACDSIDFNGDTLFPDNQDLEDFLSVFGGGVCSTGTCGDIDFNNDGLFPDNEDLEDYLIVFGGGAC
ncbi:MAG TPA: hypothetical protein VD971_11280 [Phycisphaerales bacterium]|nr:hypothetical protein [Phycisphaerales bacterium]